MILPVSCSRRRRGTTIAEMPLAMWIIILGICLPMLMIATMTLRFGFFWNACREAAQQAARCQTFQNDSAVGKSSVSVADLVATKSAQAFTGITITAVNVYIVQTDVNSRVCSKNANRQKLGAAADIDNNIYDIQVELTGQVEPLIRSSTSGMMGDIPGLTGPFPVMVRAQYVCEVPQGLNQ
jgi:hypothetical protein